MKKGKLWMVFALTAALGLTGCGAGSKSYESAAQTDSYSPQAEAPAASSEAKYESSANDSYGYEEGAEDMAVATEEGMETGAMDTAGIDSVKNTSQKLIKTVDMNLETKEFDALMTGITEKVAELGGYVQNSEISNNSYYSGYNNRYAWMNLRIPADKLDGFVRIVGEMGNVVHKNESVQDVTLEYVDVESRKKALTTEQERLLTLLENAENIEDIIRIETRLSEIRYELQYYESRLRVMDNQVNYSTVSLNISEVERITEVEEKTFFQEVSYRLADNFYDISQGARDFAIWFLSSLPYLVIWAVVICLLVWLARRALFKKKGRFFGKGRKKKGQEEELPTDHKE